MPKQFTQYTNNPVQNRMINTILHAEPECPEGTDINDWLRDPNIHLGLMNGDDVYDVANAAAALKKALDILMKDAEEYIKSCETGYTTEQWVEAAMHDWEGKYKI